MNKMIGFLPRLFFFLIRKVYPSLLKRKKMIKAGQGLNINGIPVIDIKPDCRLEIGNNVKLNSRNKSYHINMHSPVKLMADRAGAMISIGDNTRIHGSCIHAYKKITIGKNCLIAANCQIIDGNGHEISMSKVENRIHTIGDAKEITIADNVWIGANSIILPGVLIGYGSVIGAGSVVSESIPPMCIVRGNPAKIVKKYEAVL